MFSVNYYATVSGINDDAEAAVRANPRYFMAWYTIKSVGLCVAVASVAYLIGKNHGILAR
jgi:hypothetical protein